MEAWGRRTRGWGCDRADGGAEPGGTGWSEAELVKLWQGEAGWVTGVLDVEDDVRVSVGGQILKLCLHWLPAARQRALGDNPCYGVMLQTGSGEINVTTQI